MGLSCALPKARISPRGRIWQELKTGIEKGWTRMLATQASPLASLTLEWTGAEPMDQREGKVGSEGKV